MSTTTNSDGTVEAEIAGLTNPDHDVRQSSAVALGERADPALAGVVAEHLFKESDFFVRETLTWALVRVADQALPHVLARLGDQEPSEVRTQALHVLSKIADPATVTAVAPLATDPDPGVAEKARWTLGRIGDPAALPSLVALLGQGPAEEQNGLTLVLASFGETVVPPIELALRDSDARVRRHAADVLCYVGDPGAQGAVGALSQASQDPEENVAVAALVALGELTTPDAREALLNATSFDRDRLATLAVRLLRQWERRAKMADLRRRRTAES